MDTPEASLSRFEALSKEIRSRKIDVGQRLQHPGVGSSAESKLQAYRARTPYLRAYNRTTERLLDNRRHSSNGNGDASQGSDWATQPTTPADSSDIGSKSALIPSKSGSALEEVAKTNRMLRDRVKLLEEENQRYRQDVNRLGVQVDSITDESATTDQNVANLMDDLHKEKESHHKAQVSLEQKSMEVDAMRRDLDARDAEVRQARADLRSRTERLDVKTREVEQKDAELQEQAARLAEQAARLAALEAESRDANRQKVELAARIEEMQREKGAGNVDAEVTVGDGEVGVSARGPSEEKSGAEEEWAEEKQKLLKELERATAGVELKSRQLEAVNARAERTNQELLRYMNVARGGGLKSWLKSVWSSLMMLGWAGFIGFAYLLLSEDALRPRGIDVHRFAQ